MRKTIRTLAVIASASLVLGAFVAPADAKKKKKKPAPSCPAPVFVEPTKSKSASRTEAPKAELFTVTDAATEEAPLVIDYEHGPALWDTVRQEPIAEDTKWFNLLVDSAAPTAGLYVRMEWHVPSASDIDLYIWDGASGVETAHSGAINIAPVNIPIVGETGGMGWELVSGAPVGDCSGHSIESRAFTTPGEDMTLKIWLGEEVPQG